MQPVDFMRHLLRERRHHRRVCPTVVRFKFRTAGSHFKDSNGGSTFPRRHPRPCAEDLITLNKINRLQILGTGPRMTSRECYPRTLNRAAVVWSRRKQRKASFVRLSPPARRDMSCLERQLVLHSRITALSASRRTHLHKRVRRLLHCNNFIAEILHTS